MNVSALCCITFSSDLRCICKYGSQNGFSIMNRVRQVNKDPLDLLVSLVSRALGARGVLTEGADRPEPQECLVPRDPRVASELTVLLAS